jgi:uncharacterized protein involved in exopolysaccharide biosynthesis
MNNSTHDQLNQNYSDELDLGELFNILIQGKWIIFSVTTFVSIIGVIYSLQLPNIYQSRALLAPVDSSSGISGALSSYGGLAGLAGIDIPSSGNEGNSTKAILKLGSLSFFENNILPYIFLPDVMAVDSWNSNTNTLTYDESLFNKNTNTWLSPGNQIPSAQEGYGVFAGEYLNISEDKQNGILTVTIKHQSPFVAKQWAELVVNQVNAFYKQKDKSEAEKAVNYLKQQIKMTSLAEVKESIAELLKEETQKLALIEAKQLYVFEYIDPPAVMEQKSEPGRALICILSALLGGMLSIFLVLIKHYSLRKKVS